MSRVSAVVVLLASLSAAFFFIAWPATLIVIEWNRLSPSTPWTKALTLLVFWIFGSPWVLICAILARDVILRGFAQLRMVTDEA